MTFAEFKNYNRQVDRHRWSHKEFLSRHQCACINAVKHSKPGIAEILPYLFTRISDDRNLILAWDHVVAQSGSTPGRDGEVIQRSGPAGHRINTLEGLNKYQFARQVRDAIRDGRYEHGETKLVSIPKKSGEGKRFIRVPDLIDRIVQRAIVQVLQPLVDAQFYEESFGYRPRRGRSHALATAELLFEDGRGVVVTEDLKNAFDCVPQGRLLVVVRKYLPDAKLMELIDRVVRTPEGIGIRQGGSLSPLLLNLYLHHVLDRVWRRKHENVPLLRYADDLALFCDTSEQATDARLALERLIQSAGFRLKDCANSTIHDLGEGEPVGWLGFRVSWCRGEFTVGVGHDALRGLAKKIERSMQKVGSDARLPSVLFGWIGQMGPAYLHSEHDRYLAEINSMLAAAGSRKRWRRSFFLNRWHGAYVAWTQIRRRFRSFEE